MYLQPPQTWESVLLAMAQEGSHVEETAVHHHTHSNTAALDQAYDFCEGITAQHSRSFYMASSLLPRPKRRAVRALYAFCRITDDLVDSHATQSTAALARWRGQAFAAYPPTYEPVAYAWAETRRRFHIPVRYAEQLVDGVARDLLQTRYDTFTDLATYCYGVASTVGLMSMHIIGFTAVKAIPYAVKLGLALQLTNILRDVAEDWRRGRLYLPLEELAAFELGESDLAAGQVDARWRAFMQFQIARNHQLYEEAWPGIELLERDGRLAIATAAEFYRRILTDIEAHDYDVFSRRAYVSTWGKLRRLPGIWWKL